MSEWELGCFLSVILQESMVAAGEIVPMDPYRMTKIGISERVDVWLFLLVILGENPGATSVDEPLASFFCSCSSLLSVILQESMVDSPCPHNTQ